jgi:hypothetical protein
MGVEHARKPASDPPHPQPMVDAGADQIVLACTRTFLADQLGWLGIGRSMAGVARQTSAGAPYNASQLGATRGSRSRYYTSGDPDTFHAALKVSWC